MSDSDFLGRIIHYFFVLVPFIGIVYAVLTSQGNFPYNIIPIPITGGTTHFISFILICISFAVHYRKLAFLYPLARLVSTLNFTVMYIHLYDVAWSMQSQLVRGHGLNRISILFVIITFVILSKLDDNFGIINKNIKLLPIQTKMALLIILIGFTGMYLTGFWDDMEALDQGQCCVDPNQNTWWFVSKLPSFFLYLPYINKTDLKAPLKLHPRVII